MEIESFKGFEGIVLNFFNCLFMIVKLVLFG